MEIWSKTIRYSKRIRAEYKKCEAALQNNLEELDHKICHNADLDTHILDEYEGVKKELNTMQEFKGKEVIFRSKSRWIEQGENQQNTSLIQKRKTMQ